MKARKTKDIQRVLKKKGFSIIPEKDHHQYYVLFIDGKKQAIRTYFSHGKKEYNSHLMGLIKKELKFSDSNKAEDFFDCPMSHQMYVEMLKDNGSIK
ncbi:MAG: type II toxin-antitoxin system HicA family toxin [Cytophagaceae bacterium]|nr:type II toxin-antitoxin system HicA family toxin [Cytophagaceae bacterium]MBL0301711.1 type II toxin-antitoxin system HicA family toxin [Cytophagaceae bacterium]MBL0324534.1 type II toxin-antitoxin system HicA family toxin [Cytophagaceae bacterium]